MEEVGDMDEGERKLPPFSDAIAQPASKCSACFFLVSKGHVYATACKELNIPFKGKGGEVRKVM